MLKIAIGVFAAAVVGLGGYTAYNYLGGDDVVGCRHPCAEATCPTQVDNGAVSDCCRQPSRADLASAVTEGPAEIITQGTDPEVLSIPPREVK